MRFDKSSFIKTATAVLLFILTPVDAFSEEEAQQNLFGNWLGARDVLAEKGIDVESILTTDYIANTSGGIEKKDSVLGNYDLTATVDTEKAGLWKDGTLFVYMLGNFNSGRLPSEFVGDLQGSDNIEAYQTVKLYEAWYEHSFADNTLGILVGLQDFNSEFYALDYASGLLNGSFELGVETSQVGPSIFPYTAPVVRVRFSPTENIYALAAVYDGVPGDPDKPHGTHIHVGGDDGAFYSAEVGAIGEESNYYKLAVGSWYHTAKFEDYSGNDRDSNSGLYLIGEKRVISEEDEAQGLGIFAQLGFADESRNVVSSYVGGGLNYVGLIPGRDEDSTSFGVARALISGEAQRSDEALVSTETSIETNYRIQLAPYFAVTPDLQYIVNPGAAAGVKDAVVVGVRTEVAM